MARHVVGSTAAELRKLKEQMYAMLKEGGPAPTGKWADYEAFIPVRDFKARHASTLLTFDAVTDAIGQIEASKRGRMSKSPILDAKTVIPRTGTNYLPQFAHVVQGREKRVLGECFWANPIWCEPVRPWLLARASAHRHWHDVKMSSYLWCLAKLH